MRQGVYRDVERRQMNTIESQIDQEQRQLHNLQMLRQQVELEKALTSESSAKK